MTYIFRSLRSSDSMSSSVEEPDLRRLRSRSLWCLRSRLSSRSRVRDRLLRSRDLLRVLLRGILLSENDIQIKCDTKYPTRKTVTSRNLFQKRHLKIYEHKAALNQMTRQTGRCSENIPCKIPSPSFIKKNCLKFPLPNSLIFTGSTKFECNGVKNFVSFSPEAI